MLFYFTLGDAQSYFLTAIQGIDITGVFGLDFIILLVNSTLFFILQCPKNNSKSFSVLISFAIVTGWFGYGFWALQTWQQDISKWKSVNVGLIQTNRVATLNTPQPQAGYSRTFPMEMDLSLKLKKDQPDFIVWPEGNFFGYKYWENVQTSFRESISNLNIPIIFHDTTYSSNGLINNYYNSSLFINTNGNLQNIYHKIKRVPFGEYIPLTNDIPFLKAILGDYVTNLSAGTKHEVFEIGPMRLIPKLCYESLFPEFVAEAIGKDGSGKIIIVQSQDGWFGRSAQPKQHVTASSLRAVENRVPLVHAINNGPSSITLPTGEYVFQSPFFQKGQWSVPMPFDGNKGGSFYSRYPYVVISIIRLIGLSLILIKLYISAKEKQRMKRG